MDYISMKSKTEKTTRKLGAFQLSQKLDYGLALLTELANHHAGGGTDKSISDIAEERMLSFSFLQKVAGELKIAGYIVAARGRSGGYRLAKSADQISIRQIVEVLDGPIALMPCISDKKHDCPRQATCSMRAGWMGVQQELVASLSSKTLASFLQR